MKCVLCNKTAWDLCGACQETPYCSQECASKDWTHHKPMCVSGAIEPSNDNKVFFMLQYMWGDYTNYHSFEAYGPSDIRSIREALGLDNTKLDTLTDTIQTEFLEWVNSMLELISGTSHLSDPGEFRSGLLLWGLSASLGKETFGYLERVIVGASKLRPFNGHEAVRRFLRALKNVPQYAMCLGNPIGVMDFTNIKYSKRKIGDALQQGLIEYGDLWLETQTEANKRVLELSRIDLNSIAPLNIELMDAYGFDTRIIPKQTILYRGHLGYKSHTPTYANAWFAFEFATAMKYAIPPLKVPNKYLRRLDGEHTIQEWYIYKRAIGDVVRFVTRRDFVIADLSNPVNIFRVKKFMRYANAPQDVIDAFAKSWQVDKISGGIKRVSEIRADIKWTTWMCDQGIVGYIAGSIGNFHPELFLCDWQQKTKTVDIMKLENYANVPFLTRQYARNTYLLYA